MSKVGQFKSLPRCQVSDDLLWSMNGQNNCFLRKSRGLFMSMDPCNLSGVNFKAHSGVTASEGLGITMTKQSMNIKVKKSKRKANVVRFVVNVRSRRNLGKNRCVSLKNAAPHANFRYASSTAPITARSCMKVMRGMKNYRPDLHSLAAKRIQRLHKTKNAAKSRSRAEFSKKK